MSTRPDPHVFAFWEYDTAPFVLGDEGILLPNGDFRAFGFGGAIFTRKNIIAIYPVELGKEMRKRIKVVDMAYRQNLKALKDELAEEIKIILPEMARISEPERAS